MLTNLHPPKVIEFALTQITEILIITSKIYCYEKYYGTDILIKVNQAYLKYNV